MSNLQLIRVLSPKRIIAIWSDTRHGRSWTAESAFLLNLFRVGQVPVKAGGVIRHQDSFVLLELFGWGGCTGGSGVTTGSIWMQKADSVVSDPEQLEIGAVEGQVEV